MYHAPTICNSSFCWLIISLRSINELIFVMQTRFFPVEAKCLSSISMSLMLLAVKKIGGNTLA